MADDNTIYIGNKPFGAYMYSITTLKRKGYKEVHIKARGKPMSTALIIANKSRDEGFEIGKIDVQNEKSEKDNRPVTSLSIDLKLK